MGTERPNLDDEFQEADDGVIEDAAILQEIDHDRRDVPVGDPAQVDLSEIAADTARDLPETRRGGNGTSLRAQQGMEAAQWRLKTPPYRAWLGKSREAGGAIVRLANKGRAIRPSGGYSRRCRWGMTVGSMVGQTRQAAPGDYPQTVSIAARQPRLNGLAARLRQQRRASVFAPLPNGLIVGSLACRVRPAPATVGEN